jgi:hypothetical protein
MVAALYAFEFDRFTWHRDDHDNIVVTKAAERLGGTVIDSGNSEDD